MSVCQKRLVQIRQSRGDGASVTAASDNQHPHSMLQQFRMKVVQFHDDRSPVSLGGTSEGRILVLCGRSSCANGERALARKKPSAPGSSETLSGQALANAGKRILDLHPSNGLSRVQIL